jgi:hypothetical protein
MDHEFTTTAFELTEVTGSRDDRESRSFCLHHDNEDDEGSESDEER